MIEGSCLDIINRLFGFIITLVGNVDVLRCEVKACNERLGIQGEKSRITGDELVKRIISSYVLSTLQNKFAYSGFKNESKPNQESDPAFTP